MANSVYPVASDLCLHCCLGLSVPILSVITEALVKKCCGINDFLICLQKHFVGTHCKHLPDENIMHHAKTCLRAYVDSKVPDQPVHSRSLIKVFAVCKQNH